MKILITGGSGFIGKELGQFLIAAGHELLLVTRNTEKAKLSMPFDCGYIEADLTTDIIRHDILRSVDAVIHLMGESIDGRWTPEKKRSIYESRVKSSQHLLQSFSDMKLSPKVFISASAIGYYGDRGDETLTEESAAGQGFLAQVCLDWERPFEVAKQKYFSNSRFVTTRFGLVLSNKGGAFLKIVAPFRMGLASPLGDGKQWMSWIHLEDLCKVLSFAVSQHNVSGVINVVSPQPVTNREFSEVLAGILKKRILPAVPKFVLKAALGEMSALLLDSQKVRSLALEKLDFEFSYPTLEAALQNIARTNPAGSE